MGTKEQGWSAAFSAVRFLALALSVSTAVALAARPVQAADAKKAREKIVEYNKQALLSYEAKDFETAKTLLGKALKESKDAGLDDDKMTARTYLHLGAVYWSGYQDQASALQNFSAAKKIRPDIQLTPSIETSDLKSVFDLASAEGDTTPPPAPTPAPKTARPTPARPARPVAAPVVPSGDGDDEPELPASMSAPLMCTVPDATPPGKELSIRCALKPGINARVVQLHYRSPGVEAYQVAQMKKTPRGWWLGTLPGSVMKAGTLQIYFDARDAGDKELASNGQVDSPSVIEVRKRSASEVTVDDDEDPMKHIRQKQRDEAYEAGLHRRREGAVWVGMGFGSGFGYAPAGALEWRKINVSAVTAPVGMFHLLPEIGYMWSDHFAVAVQGIYEFIRQDQLQGETGPTFQGAPANKGGGGLGRAIFLTDLAGGNLQFQFGGDVGAGYLRIPVAPVRGNETTNTNGDKVLDSSTTIYKTDTRAIGIVLVGASAGFAYHISRHFALAIEGRALTGFPNFGAVLQGWFSAQVAFGGKAGPAQAEEGEGEGTDVGSEPPPSSGSEPESESEEE